MMNIKYRILISFCITTAVIITGLGLVVSLVIKDGISQQTTYFSDRFEADTYNLLNVQLKLLDSSIDDIKREVSTSTSHLILNDNLATSLEAAQEAALQKLMESKFSDGWTDFGWIFDLEGHAVAAYPRDTGLSKINSYYQSSDFKGQLDKLLKSESETTEGITDLVKFDLGILNKSEQIAFSGSSDNAIAAISGAIVFDDFGDPIGYAVTGKLLNGYQAPLQEIYDSVHSAAILYMGSIPITQVGLTQSTTGGNKANSARIDDNVKASIYGASEPVNERLTFGTDAYFTSSIALRTVSNQPLGIITVGIPKHRVYEVVDTINIQGHHFQQEVQNWILGIGILSIGVFIVVSLIIATRIVKPIKLLQSVIEHTEHESDLNARIKVNTNDEIGHASNSFNCMIEKFQKTIEQVTVTTDKVADAAGAISVIAEKEHQSVQHQQSEMERLTTAAVQMAASAQEVSSNTLMAAEMATLADKQSKEGQREVSHAIESIKTLATNVEIAVGVIQQLETDSDLIGTVVNVIGDIAEQTNLLALNAAIEAARAGEHGRGFSVVADEVRKLASRTQKSTQEIQIMIEKLQGAAKNAVGVMVKGSEQAHKSVDQASQAGSTLTAIIEGFTSISEMNNQTAAASKQQSTVAEDISQNIMNITRVVETSAEGATKTAHASEDLNVLAGDLKALIAQFNNVKLPSEQQQADIFDPKLSSSRTLKPSLADCDLVKV